MRPPAENAVQTYKSCFKSTTALLPSTFPISYWCHLLEQIDLTVNIVRPCRKTPEAFRVGSNRGRVAFWQHANRSSRDGNANVCPPRKQEELWTQRKQGVVRWTVLEALSYVQRHIAVDGQGQDGGYSKNEASCYCDTKANVG